MYNIVQHTTSGKNNPDPPSLSPSPDRSGYGDQRKLRWTRLGIALTTDRWH